MKQQQTENKKDFKEDVEPEGASSDAPIIEKIIIEKIIKTEKIKING